MVASAGGHFLCSVIVNPNQCRPSSLPIISDGPLLFDQAEPMASSSLTNSLNFKIVSYSPNLIVTLPPNKDHMDPHKMPDLDLLSV